MSIRRSASWFLALVGVGTMTAALIAAVEPAPFIKRGKELEAQKKYAEAVAEYTKAVNARPLDGSTRALRGWARHLQGDNQGALEDLEYAAFRSPEDSRLHLMCGLVYRDLGNLPIAAREFAEAARLDPKSGRAPGEQAGTLYKLGDHAGAVTAATEAIRRNPDIFGYYQVRALAQEKLGKLPDALADLDKADALVKDDKAKEALATIRQRVFAAQNRPRTALDRPLIERDANTETSKPRPEEPARAATTVTGKESPPLRPGVEATATPANARKTPAARPGTATPAVALEPLPGIHLSAPAGALDRPRDFKATALPAAQLRKLDQQLLPGGVMLLDGCELQAGMSERELFPGQLAIAFDLEKRGIPKELWDDLVLLHQDTQGKLRLLLAERQGARLACKVRHNGAFTLAVLVPTLVGVMIYGWQTDRADVPQGDYTSVFWPPDQRRFQLLYPRGWPPANPAEVERAAGELNRLYAKHEVSARKDGGDWGDPKEVMAERCQRLRRLEQDPDYRNLQVELRSPKWLQENLLPRRVVHGAAALDAAFDYLCGDSSRGFRRPGAGGLEQVTEVYFAGNSMGAGYGESRNLWTKAPFMVLDGTKIPDAAVPDAEGRKERDALFATALHEFFHVIQCAYVLYDSETYLWFNEATATALEYEAKVDYLARGLVTTWDDKSRFYDAFFQPLDYTDPAGVGTTQHGYGASYFVEFLRDRHSKDKARTFLPALLEDFAGIRGGVVNSLWRVTSGAAEGLQRDFQDFCRAHRDDLGRAAPTRALRPDQPFVLLPLETPQPLCVTALRVEVNPAAFAPGALKGASLAVLDTSAKNAGVTLAWQVSGGGWADAVPETCTAGPVPEGTMIKRLSVVRCESYVQAPAIKPGSTAVFLLAQPQQPPTATMVRDKLGYKIEVRVPATPLWRASLPSFGSCLRGYALYLRGPANAALVMGPTAPGSGGETVFTVADAELRTKLAGGKPGPFPLRLTYAECPAGSISLVGPESQPLALTWGDFPWQISWGPMPPGWTVSNGAFLRDQSNVIAGTGERKLVDNPEFGELLYFRFATDPVPRYEVRAIVEIGRASQQDFSTPEKITAHFRGSRGEMTPGYRGTKECLFQGQRALRYDVDRPAIMEKEWGYFVEIDPARKLWSAVMCHVHARYSGPRAEGPSKEEQLGKCQELEQTVERLFGKNIRLEPGLPAGGPAGPRR